MKFIVEIEDTAIENAKNVLEYLDGERYSIEETLATIILHGYRCYVWKIRNNEVSVTEFKE